MPEQQTSGGSSWILPVFLIGIVIVVALVAGAGTAFKFSQIPTWFWFVAIGFIFLKMLGGGRRRR